MKTDMLDWNSGDEIVEDDDDDIEEHIVLDQSKTEVEIEENIGDARKELSEIRSSVYEESGESMSELNKEEPSREELKKLWFRKQSESGNVVTYKANIDASGIREPKKGIISWFFDTDLKLFVIKRYDGIQYLKNSLKTFNSIPKCEIKDLAKKPLINPGSDP